MSTKAKREPESRNWDRELPRLAWRRRAQPRWVRYALSVLLLSVLGYASGLIIGRYMDAPSIIDTHPVKGDLLLRRAGSRVELAGNEHGAGERMIQRAANNIEAFKDGIRSLALSC